MNATMEAPAQPLARGNSNGGSIQPATARRSALAAMAERFAIEPARLMTVLKATIIKGTDGRPASDDEVAAFIVVANQYGLNPFTREIHAFADPRKGIVPIVGIDGWAHIVNAEPRFDGCTFKEIKDGEDLGVECTMYVKDRAHPIALTEWLSECKRNTPPWNTMRRRMLRHKAFMQCSRIAFSISGIYDEDEARDIIVNDAKPAAESSDRGVAGLAKQISSRPVSEGQTFDTSTGQLNDDEAERILQDAAARAKGNQQAQDPQTANLAPSEPAADNTADALAENEADESDIEGERDEIAILEAVQDLDDAKRNMRGAIKRRLPSYSAAQFSGDSFKWLQARGVGDFAKSTVDQRIALWKEIKAGTFPPAT